MSFIEHQAQAHNERIAKQKMQIMEHTLAFLSMTAEEKAHLLRLSQRAVIATAFDGMTPSIRSRGSYSTMRFTAKLPLTIWLPEELVGLSPENQDLVILRYYGGQL